MKNNSLIGLEALGQSVWLDNLSRSALDNGRLRCMKNKRLQFKNE